MDKPPPAPRLCLHRFKWGLIALAVALTGVALTLAAHTTVLSLRAAVEASGARAAAARQLVDRSYRVVTVTLRDGQVVTGKVTGDQLLCSGAQASAVTLPDGNRYATGDVTVDVQDVTFPPRHDADAVVAAALLAMHVDCADQLLLSHL